MVAPPKDKVSGESRAGEGRAKEDGGGKEGQEQEGKQPAGRGEGRRQRNPRAAAGDDKADDTVGFVGVHC